MNINKQLNTNYFRYLGNQSNGFNNYECWAPRGHPMILFSEDGTPLASLEIRAKDLPHQRFELGSRGVSFITEHVSESFGSQSFKGFISLDKQEFEIIISNLLHENIAGFLHINIFKSDKIATEIDAGGINEVNELRPGESYSIVADKQTGNSSLILSSKPSDITTDTSKPRQLWTY